MDEGTEKFLGRDFLNWLWYFTEQEESKFIVPDLGEFEVGIDGPLALVAENFGAFESVLRKGLPTKSPEAHMALQAGKKLKSAQVMLGLSNIWFSLPLSVAVGHNVVAACLMMTLIGLTYRLRRKI